MNLLRSAVLYFLCMVLPAAVHAACEDLRKVSLAQVETFGIKTVQDGLRTVFQDDYWALEDGVLGDYTRSKLNELCDAVARDGDDDVASTLLLAQTYGKLTNQAGKIVDWYGELYGETTLNALKDPAAQLDKTLPLRLAGTPRMTAKALGDATPGPQCSAVRASIAASAEVRTATAKLLTLTNSQSPSDLCQVLPVSGTVAEFSAAIVHFAALETALPGALDDLADPSFASWLAEDANPRLLPLVGSPASVAQVLRAYRARDTSEEPEITLGPCDIDIVETTTTYFSLSAEEIAQLEPSPDLKTLLTKFATDNPSLGSARHLWSKLEETLAPQVDVCILPVIRDLVLSEQPLAAIPVNPADTNEDIATKEIVFDNRYFLGRSYALNAEQAGKLAEDTTLTEFMPTIQGLTERSARTELRMVNLIESALAANLAGEAKAEIEAVADTLASAAEEVEPLLDETTLDPELIADAPQPMTVGVTDPTIQSVMATIENQAYAEALNTSKFLPVANLEQLKSQVRTILRPLAEEKVAQKVADAARRVIPTAEANWTLTEDLQTAILAVPYIQQAQDDPTEDMVQDRLKELTGIIYPSKRLFEKALATVPKPTATADDPDAKNLSAQLQSRIINVAMKQVTDTTSPRIVTPYAKPGCGCVSHPGGNPEVYAFYPFWFSPVLPEPSDPATEGEAPPPPTPEQIDFSLVQRVAFYGLEFAYDTVGPSRQVVLRHAEEWALAKRSFINAAHRHRAKVDLTFDLRGWQDWKSRDIETVVSSVVQQMAPLDTFASNKLSDIWAAIPTLFDTTQADGLTLVFQDYQSKSPRPGQSADTKDMDQMLSIIRQIYQALPNRDRVEINVAFDFALVEQDLKKGIFDDLYDVVLENPAIVRTQDRDSFGQPISGAEQRVERDQVKMVKRILLFLERKTSDNKKGIRTRMEEGFFKGKDRADVLHSILPILPAGGHEFVQPSTQFKQSASQRETFGQFEDDVVYFKNNFKGVGLWPMPVLGGPETDDINKILTEQHIQRNLPGQLGTFEASYDAYCTWACPNRAALGLFAIFLFVVVTGLTYQSYRSGTAEKLAFHRARFGLARWMVALIFLILVTLTSCDAAAVVAPYLMWGFVALMAFLALAALWRRAHDGPMP